MTTQVKDDVLSHPELWAGLADGEWVALHVPRLKAVRPAYALYETFLKAALKDVAAKFAPMAIVDARAKAVPSFAEKILRKKAAYVDPHDPLPPDPLVRMTDLCGGRVICRTAEEVAAVCAVIEKAFEIDWPNSEDVSRRLQPQQFGYRSVHYIVMVDSERLARAGIRTPVPPELRGFGPDKAGPTAADRPLKAEVQVRTLLEHASADIAHDMIYKTEIKVPERLVRRYSRLAAVLEGADEEFRHLIHGFDAFQSNFGAHMESRKQVEEEIARLRIVLRAEPDNAKLAVKIAQLALDIGDYELCIEVLDPYRDFAHAGVLRALGTALTELHWDHSRSEEFRQGRKHLEAGCELAEKDAEALCALAETWVRTGNNDKARGIFSRAMAADPTEPGTLCRYLEFEISHLNNTLAISLTEPMIRRAMERCRQQIEARANPPRAWSSLALFQLFLGRPFEALDSLAKLVSLCEAPGKGRPGRLCAAGRALVRLGEGLERIGFIKEKLEGFDWFERVLLLGLAVRLRDGQALGKLEELATKGKEAPEFKRDEAVVILSGGCIPEMQPFLDGLRPRLLRGVEGLSFTLLGGGTTTGISGLAGDVAAGSGGHVRAIGYLPSRLPRGVQEDTARFAKRPSSRGVDFTPLDPLQGWTDLAVAGVDPGRVKVLAYAGGAISRVECAVALALGARVGVIEDPALPKDRQFDAPAWQGHSQLAPLPMDAMTLRAFLLVDAIPCRQADRKKYEKAAEQAHKAYVAAARPKDPSLASWKDLSEDLKASNFHQVVYAENILKTAGLGIRPIKKAGGPLFDMEKDLGKEGVERLAEMEHGRWNAERLLRGWRYAVTKDVANKLNPSLVPWSRLTDGVKWFDLDAIRKLPEKLETVGLEIYRV